MPGSIRSIERAAAILRLLSVRIGTLLENQVLIVHHVFRPDDSRQALEVGSLVPAHATVPGKALLAKRRYLPAEVLTSAAR